jgi:hypothetical protein
LEEQPFNFAVLGAFISTSAQPTHYLRRVGIDHGAEVNETANLQARSSASSLDT